MIKPTLEYGALSKASDESLMSAITRRKQSALNELYNRYGTRLRSVIGNVVHEEADADDVLQEIMLQIWKEADHYSPTAGKPLGWVVTLARRRAIDRVRRRQAYCRAKDRFSEQLNQRSNGHRTVSGNAEVSRVDMHSFLEKQLRRLPAQQRQAIRLSFFKGLSHREIAQVTRTPLGTVKTRLELGLQKLTQHMRPLRQKI
ncbi:MAG: polymerase sigma-70 factor, subfamily [Verrucomicrobiota bacterium]|jgi:RNA polymerase sigma-70 factor (ECF subfamily)